MFEQTARHRFKVISVAFYGLKDVSPFVYFRFVSSFNGSRTYNSSGW